jgi:hypothetical protein
MDVLQFSIIKRRLSSSSSSRSAKLHSRSIDNSSRSPSNLRLNSSRNSSLCNNKRRRSPHNDLHLSSSRNNSLYNRRRKSPDNLRLRSSTIGGG